MKKKKKFYTLEIFHKFIEDYTKIRDNYISLLGQFEKGSVKELKKLQQAEHKLLLAKEELHQIFKELGSFLGGDNFII